MALWISASSFRIVSAHAQVIRRSFFWEQVAALNKKKKDDEALLDDLGEPFKDVLAHFRKDPVPGFDPILTAHFATAQPKGFPIRGVASLPHPSGKINRVAVFTKDPATALAAGAFEAGGNDLVEQILKGHSIHLYDYVVATPEVLPALEKIREQLGKAGLFPKVKIGTVTEEVEKAVKHFRTSFLFSSDRGHWIHGPIGKLSSSDEQILENFQFFLNLIKKKRPSDSPTPRLFNSIHLQPSFGPSLQIKMSEFPEAVQKYEVKVEVPMPRIKKLAREVYQKTFEEGGQKAPRTVRPQKVALQGK